MGEGGLAGLGAGEGGPAGLVEGNLAGLVAGEGVLAGLVEEGLAGLVAGVAGGGLAGLVAGEGGLAGLGAGEGGLAVSSLDTPEVVPLRGKKGFGSEGLTLD